LGWGVQEGRNGPTARVRRVLTMAEDEAAGLRHAEVGTEHLLLALLHEGRGLAARVIQELGVNLDDLERRVRSRQRPSEIGADGPIGLGPGARAAFEMARAEAARMHHEYLGTEHLLLGLLRNGEGPAFVVLNGAGVTLGPARHRVLRILSEAQTDGPPAVRPAEQPNSRRSRLPGRFSTPERADPPDDVERCGRCGRVRRPDWRFCAFCGERWPACDRCEAPVPRLTGVRFCPGCGTMRDADARA
jgi:ATP-dependent Clp protease ATP-binding subunit ClpA